MTQEEKLILGYKSCISAIAEQIIDKPDTSPQTILYFIRIFTPEIYEHAKQKVEQQIKDVDIKLQLQ